MFRKSVNVNDAAEAKAFLLGHSRSIKDGIYVNKFCKGVNRKGVSKDKAAEAFENVFGKAQAAFKQDVGYALNYDGKRFELAAAEEGKDVAGLFTGNQMKLKGMEPVTLTAHAAVVVLFDEACSNIVKEYKDAVDKMAAENAPADTEDVAEDAAEAAAVA